MLCPLPALESKHSVLSLLGKHSSPEPTPSSLTVFDFVMVFLLPLILDSFSCSGFMFHDSSCQSLSTLHKLEISEKREFHLRNCLQEMAGRQECGTFSWLLVDGRDSPHWGQCGGHCVWGQECIEKVPKCEPRSWLVSKYFFVPQRSLLRVPSARFLLWVPSLAS